MPLAASRNAIGELTRHLAVQLTARTDANTVDVGRPELAASAGAVGPKLNLFCFAFKHDAHMRNIPLDRGQAPPFWLSLSFLMTAVDVNRDTDSPDALDLLGQGLLALRDIDMQTPPATALADNPEPIKITFHDSEAELLSSVMQGSDESYRLAACFEVRPLMLARVNGSAGGPPILTVGPPGDEGVLVLPSLGPRLDTVEPASFEVGDAIELQGRDLSADAVEVCFDDVCVAIPPGDVSSTRVRVTVPAPPAANLSAGSRAVTLVRLLPSGRRFASNAALGRLKPTVAGAAAIAPLTPEGVNLSGDLTITGDRLGGPNDSIFVGFYADGLVRGLFEAAGTAAQTSLTVTVRPEEALPPGNYRILLRVNGEQATVAPSVSWT